MLSRLGPQKQSEASTAAESDDPFAMTELREALPGGKNSPKTSASQEISTPVTQLDGLEWRIASALLAIQLSLGEAYAIRGSAREAEFFIQQSEELARVLGSQAMTSRALLRKAEIQLALCRFEEAQKTLEEAREMLSESTDMDMIDVNRALGDLLVRHSSEGDAREQFECAMRLLCSTQESYREIEQVIVPQREVKEEDFFAPLQRGRILRQQGECIQLL